MQKPADEVIRKLILAVRDNLSEAHAIAKAANKMAQRGRPSQALKMLMDFEGHALDAHDLFKAALNVKNHLLTEPGQPH